MGNGLKPNDWILISAGATMGLVVGALYAASGGEAVTAMLIGGRVQWETLLTGGAAICAAIWTVRAMRDQMSQAERIAADRRSRRERAARATLPLALSEICDYAIPCMVKFSAMLDSFPDDGGSSTHRASAHAVASNWQPPQVPKEALSVLKDCIEFADDDAAAAMARLVRHLQVHHARMIGLVSKLRSSRPGSLVLAANVDQAILDAAALHGMACAIFDFSRGKAGAGFESNGTSLVVALHSANLFQGASKAVDRIYSKALLWESSEAISQ